MTDNINRERARWHEHFVPKKQDDGMAAKDKNAFNLIRNFFNRAFLPKATEQKEDREWSPGEYVSEFYGPLDPENLEIILAQIENGKIDSKMDILGQDIDNIVIDLKKISAGLQEQSLEYKIEDLENYSILYFMANEVLPKVLTDRPEDHLKILDVGSGPTIYQFIFLAALAGKIQPSEWLEANRQFTCDWIDGQNNYDWSSYSKCLSAAIDKIKLPVDDRTRQKINSFIENPSSIEEYLHQILAKPVKVDVFATGLEIQKNIKEDLDPDLVHVGKEGSIELLTSNFCVESAFIDNLDDWHKGMKNITDEIRTGGFLVMTAITGSTWYLSGPGKTCRAANVNSEILTKELLSLGFEIKSLMTLKGKTLEDVKAVGMEKEYSGYSGMSFVLAKKK
ncbi:MAG: hypothetical protein WC107_01880 [Patescibacteria group bacterium]